MKYATQNNTHKSAISCQEKLFQKKIISHIFSLLGIFGTGRLVLGALNCSLCQL